jgi:hypothetical protein
LGLAALKCVGLTAWEEHGWAPDVPRWEVDVDLPIPSRRICEKLREPRVDKVVLQVRGIVGIEELPAHGPLIIPSPQVTHNNGLLFRKVQRGDRYDINRSTVDDLNRDSPHLMNYR